MTKVKMLKVCTDGYGIRSSNGGPNDYRGKASFALDDSVPPLVCKDQNLDNWRKRLVNTIAYMKSHASANNDIILATQSRAFENAERYDDGKTFPKANLPQSSIKINSVKIGALSDEEIANRIIEMIKP